MKKYITLLILIIPLASLAQVSSEFDGQLASYQKFTSLPIHIPKNNEDINIDTSKRSAYLKWDYKGSNFYLDKNSIAWGSNWFAWANGGIAKRWKTSSPKKYADKDELNLGFWAKLKTMTKEEIANLSPVEKYDIYACEQFGEFFWASNQELISRGPYKLPALDANGKEIPCGFCGFCNGARVSGALMKEPVKEIVVKAKNHPEIDVVFYPADIKALLAASYYYLDNSNTLNIGTNYDNEKSAEYNKSHNPNPAVLDVILREYLSTYKLPFFIDVQYNNEIWNETVLGFDRTVIQPISNVAPGQNSNPLVAKEVFILCTLYCQDEMPTIQSINQKTTDLMANKSYAISQGWVKQRKYKYKLFTDKDGKIIDGSWVGSYLDVSKPGEPVKMAWTNLPVDFIWLAKGEGADSKHTYNGSDPATANYTGNKNIKFKDIYDLVQLSSEK